MIRGMYPFLTHCEGELALKACGGDEDDTAAKLTNYDFLHEIRKQVALEYGKPIVQNTAASRQHAATVEGCLAARNRKVGEVLQKKKVREEKIKRIRLDDALKAAQDVRIVSHIARLLSSWSAGRYGGLE